jgi:FKBP-type peptidyl-prolyl cis-trans isomerase
MKNQKENMWVIVSFVIVVCIIVSSVYFILNKKDENSDLLENKISDNKIDDKAKDDSNIKTEENKTSIKNMEKISKNGDVLVMNYTGRLTNGTVFDSNVDPKFNHVEPFKFTLGAGQVIKGWDEGLLGMKIGEKKTLTIPPEKGYGSRAVSTIPANSTLIFEVELVGIE